jgi:hypothetical protein
MAHLMEGAYVVDVDAEEQQVIGQRMQSELVQLKMQIDRETGEEFSRDLSARHAVESDARSKAADGGEALAGLGRHDHDWIREPERDGADGLEFYFCHCGANKSVDPMQYGGGDCGDDYATG